MKKPRKQGFTLVELVVVIAILAILAAIAIPTVSHLVGQAQRAADDTTAHALLNAIKVSEAQAVAGTLPGTPYGKAHPAMLKDDYYEVELEDFLLLNFGISEDKLRPQYVLPGSEANHMMFCYVQQEKVVSIDAQRSYPPVTKPGYPHDWWSNPMLYSKKLFPSFPQVLKFHLDGTTSPGRQRPF